MYDDTITLFNHRNGLWYPSVISGVDLKVTTSSSITTGGINNVGEVSIIVHTSKSKAIKTKGGLKQYVEPLAFKVVDDPEYYLTFKPEEDFILAEEYEGGIEDDDDYDSGFYDELKSTRDGVYKIQAAAWYSLLPHFEIGAK